MAQSWSETHGTSWGLSTASASRSTSRGGQERPRALLTAEEIRRLGDTDALVLASGAPPILARKLGTARPALPTRLWWGALAQKDVCATAAGALLLLAALAPLWQTQLPATVAQMDALQPAFAAGLAPAPSAPASMLPPAPTVQATGPTPPPSVPPALQPMDTGQAASPQGPPEPRALPSGMVLSQAPPAGTSRWELRIKVGDRPVPELHRHAQTERGCQDALEQLRTERQARREGERIAWERKPYGEVIKLQAWCEARGG